VQYADAQDSVESDAKVLEQELETLQKEAVNADMPEKVKSLRERLAAQKVHLDSLVASHVKVKELGDKESIQPMSDKVQHLEKMYTDMEKQLETEGNAVNQMTLLADQLDVDISDVDGKLSTIEKAVLESVSKPTEVQPTKGKKGKKAQPIVAEVRPALTMDSYREMLATVYSTKDQLQAMKPRMDELNSVTVTAPAALYRVETIASKY
jgi:chromosome segregation ATPase